ncbi:cadherin-like domain-containing protein [Vibrio lentus]|nr:cadherin-like domain-containing protein [Vibrio lentus]
MNDGQKHKDQAFTVNEDGVLTFTDQDLLTGATDIEGDDLSVEGVTYTGADGPSLAVTVTAPAVSAPASFNGDVNFSFNAYQMVPIR